MSARNCLQNYSAHSSRQDKGYVYRNMHYPITFISFNLFPIEYRRDVCMQFNIKCAYDCGTVSYCFIHIILIILIMTGYSTHYTTLKYYDYNVNASIFFPILN